MTVSAKLLQAAKTLRGDVDRLRFSSPVEYVYNPLGYAWEAHREYLERFADSPKRVIFLGMNPGPWGMAQTGVPFGEIAAVRDWMGLQGRVGKPAAEHPKRPVTGLDCPRSEVSGRRLWGWAADRFGSPEAFFERFFILNYCPLSFMEGETGRNRIPEKLPKEERTPLFAACDRALRATLEALEPTWVVGVGAFAEKCASRVLGGDTTIRVGRVLHPSPASPKANRGWAPQADAELQALGIDL